MNSLPTITKNLLIINALMFASKWVASLYGIDLSDILGLHFVLASDFHFYQLFTYMFMHAGFTHIFFNMFAVWMFGRIMETTLGPKRFLFYYLTCGLGAGIIQEGVQYIHYLNMGFDSYEMVNTGHGIMQVADYLNRWTCVGASGCVYGVLLSFGMTFPEERMFIIPFPFPIKAKYFVVGYAVIEVLYAVEGSNDGVAHFAHLGGMLFGLILLLQWRGGRGGGNGWTELWHKFRMWLDGLKRGKQDPNIKVTWGGKHGQDMDYNQQRNQREQEMDRILDKVRKHGYGSLTDEEKQKLFSGGR